MHEVRIKNYEARYVGGHMQINPQFNFIEICRKKVLLCHIFRGMLTLTSSLRLYQMFWCLLIKRSIIFSWFVICDDAVTDATLICIARHAWPSLPVFNTKFLQPKVLHVHCMHVNNHYRP